MNNERQIGEWLTSSVGSKYKFKLEQINTNCLGSTFCLHWDKLIDLQTQCGPISRHLKSERSRVSLALLAKVVLWIVAVVLWVSVQTWASEEWDHHLKVNLNHPKSLPWGDRHNTVVNLQGGSPWHNPKHLETRQWHRVHSALYPSKRSTMNRVHSALYPQQAFYICLVP